MDKIASPDDLTRELRALLAYSRTDRPSRERIASTLKALADRVAVDKAAVSLFDTIGPGDKVTIVDSRGQQLTGTAKMLGPAGWVLNLGGRFGRPGIASDENVVKVVRKR